MIKNKLIFNAKKTDDYLRSFLKKQKQTDLLNVMKYSTLSGGKKIRSSIIINMGKLFNLNFTKILNLCGAVECIHSYSLIHDDLPCMDNDKIRRGKPSTHVKFGESTAILAGNSLLTLAFEMITDKNYLISDESKIELVKSLSLCAGHTGIAGGQHLDLSFENKKKNLRHIISMQKKKPVNYLTFAVILLV
jgi:farnesyl diphosphate synthase